MTSTSRPLLRRPLVLSLLVAGLLVIAGGAALALKKQSPTATKAALDEGKTKAAPTLEFSAHDAAPAQSVALARNLAVTGSLTTPVQAQVKPMVSAQVRRVLVREGDAVKQGQLLVELDNADLRARLDAVIADQEERRARLSIAKANRDNNQALLARNFISRNAFDQTESAYQAALAALRWADAQTRLAQNALNDAQVLAPISGFVAKRLVNGGERVGPESPLMQLVDLARMELEASVPVADVPQLHLGQTVKFSVDGFGERRFAGQIERINPVVEAGTRGIRIFASVPNPDGLLRGGMFATGTIETGLTAAMPVVPVTAVFEEAGQRYLFLIDHDKLVKRAVVVGSNDEATGKLAIESGLAAGEVVVHVRFPGLKDGAPAHIKASAPTTP